MEQAEEQQLSALIRDSRWCALATVEDRKPLASNVAYALNPECSGLLLHLSRLARHTINLLEYSSASLAISEAEANGRDPQTLARVSLQGAVVEIPRDSEAYAVLKECYLTTLPEAEQLFGFADFILFRFEVEKVRFVAGFGKSYTISPETLQRICRERQP